MNSTFLKTSWTPPRGILGVLSILVELAVILVNILPLAVVRKLHSTSEITNTDVLIGVASVFYILSVFICSPLGVISYFSGVLREEVNTCYALEIAILFFQLVPLVINTYMSCDILYRIKQSMKPQLQLIQTRRFLGILFLSIGLSFLVSLLPLLRLLFVESNKHTKCELWIAKYNTTWQHRLYTVIFLLYGYSNIIIGGVSLMWISVLFRVKNIHTATNQCTETSDLLSSEIFKRTSELTKMACTVIGVVYVTWIPVLLMVTLKESGYEVSAVTIQYTMVGLSLPGLINPLLYGLLSSRYTRGYEILLKKLANCCSSRKENITEQEMEERHPQRAQSDYTINFHANEPRRPICRSQTFTEGVIHKVKLQMIKQEGSMDDEKALLENDCTTSDRNYVDVTSESTCDC